MGYRSFSFSQNTLGIWCNDLVQTAVFVTKKIKNKKKKVKFHPLLTFSERVHIVHFCSCLLCRLGYLQDCVQCAKLPLSTGVEQAFMIFLSYSFICPLWNGEFWLGWDKKVLYSVFSAFWCDLYRKGHIFYLLLSEFERFFLNCS